MKGVNKYGHIHGEYMNIQEMTGKQFTWDVAANNEGTNAERKKESYKGNTVV